MTDCRQELCPMWGGDDCPCEIFGLDPDDLPDEGIFSIDEPGHGYWEVGDY